MNCELDKIGFQGNVQLVEYDFNGRIVDNVCKKNTILNDGFQMYSAILSNFMKNDFPSNETYNNDEQCSVLSNYIQFGSQSGDVPFLFPQVVKKDLIKINAGCYQAKISGNFKDASIAKKNNVSQRVKNGNSCFDNTDTNVTLIKNNVGNNSYTQTTDNYYYDDLRTYYYVYNVDESVFDDQTKFSGLRIDLSGIQNKKNYFRVCFVYDQDSIFSQTTESSTTTSSSTIVDYLQVDKLHSTFPLLNGKPVCKQYNSLYGGRFNGNEIYSYFFDMYPRFYKMPKKIIFIFQSGGIMVGYNKIDYSSKNEVFVERIQFFTHKQPKCGPLGFYLRGVKNGDVKFFRKKIMRTYVKDGYLCYYVKIDYNQANDFDKIEFCGLCNAKENFIYQPQHQLNELYSNKGQAYNKNDNSNWYFFRKKYKNANEYDNLLTQLKYQFVKTSDKRIDIIYKIKIDF